MSNATGRGGPPVVTGKIDSNEESFLGRWSRRKQRARADTEKTTPEAPVTTPPPAAQEVLTDTDMPPIESLNEESDYSPFMSSGVSEELRRKALRKLFLLPSVNQREPLDSEYYDCHGFEPLGNTITHEMREEMEREAQKLTEQKRAASLGEDKPVPEADSNVELSPPIAAGPAPAQELQQDVDHSGPTERLADSETGRGRKLVKRRRP